MSADPSIGTAPGVPGGGAVCSLDVFDGLILWIDVVGDPPPAWDPFEVMFETTLILCKWYGNNNQRRYLIK